ncbi:nuclear receptor-binding protein homolog [Venturia canescens]|uniref:nuclear receptor-binding protein homolog n=1 Tax=Venturia canescens TaxID=32260 RepID=UPI001C9C4B1F|nr:nuclear receptor-binding protein homolog [Venturia canescens]
MPGSRSSTDPEHKSPRESGEDSEDESEILEESPCGRWLKRREEVYVGTKSALIEGGNFALLTRSGENENGEMQVIQRDVPEMNCAYLAMDTEEGVEVVWNEVQFSERKNFKAQEERIQMVFENLTQLEHPNIVKFHRYWTDTHNDKPRVIYITEYMSSGSLKQFLKRTKRNVKKLPLQAWKRWCTQILSALSYLHSCSPPIIHGNLTCDTIFIQHNGLVKIGSDSATQLSSPAIDIYAFGICALEMAALEIQGNGDSGTMVTEEHIRKTVDSLDERQQKDFIRKCLEADPQKRPSARELLFHPVLFEVHALKLLAAHTLINSTTNTSETITDEVLQRLYSPDTVLAEVKYQGRPPQQFRLSDIPVAEKLEKFVEDVKYGIYPLTAFIPKSPPPVRTRAISPEVTESVKSVTPEPVDVESRRVVNMMCNVKPREESCELLMTILLRMDDKMNRQLTCPISQIDTSMLLAQELVHFGFINENDRDKIGNLIEEALHSCFNKQLMSPGSTSLPSLPSQTTGSGQAAPGHSCLQNRNNSISGSNTTASSNDSVSSLPPKMSGLSNSYNRTGANYGEGDPPTITDSVS